MAKSKRSTDAILKELRAFGLAYPGAHTKSPWPGHLDLAVNDKTFAYLSLEGEPLGVSCKLPRSGGAALLLPFTTPAAYGLGKSGWVSASFEAHEPPVGLLKEWIDESYRAQAPKKLVRQLDEAEAPAAKPKAAPKRKATRAKAAAPAKAKRAASARGTKKKKARAARR